MTNIVITLVCDHFADIREKRSQIDEVSLAEYFVSKVKSKFQKNKTGIHDFTIPTELEKQKKNNCERFAETSEKLIDFTIKLYQKL